MKTLERFVRNMVLSASAVLVAGALTTVSASAAPSGSAGTRLGAAAATAEILPAGHQGNAASVPWSQVGPGWLLSEWSTSFRTPNTHSLFLVDPLGGRYLITAGAATPPGNLVAWSGDGARALFAGGGSGATVLQLRSGRSTRFAVSGPTPYPSAVSFTEPDGTSIIGESFSGGGEGRAQVERFDLHGALEYTYPKSFLQAGQLEAGVLYSPAGTELVMTTTSGFELVANAGQPIRYLPMRAAAGSCQPMRWWAAGVVLATCPAPRGPALLWLVPIDGAAPTQLTVAGDDSTGDVDAWSLSSGDYTQDLGACGLIYLAKVGPDRKTKPVNVPGSVGSDLVVGAYADQLALTTRFACQGGNSTLFWFNPATNAITPLLGPRANGGNAGPAVLFGQTSDLYGFSDLGLM